MTSLLWWIAETTIVVALLIPVVQILCRFLRWKPAVQHMLWAIMLLKLALPPILSWPVALSDLVPEGALTSVRVTVGDGLGTAGRGGYPSVPTELQMLGDASTAIDKRHSVRMRKANEGRRSAVSAPSLLLAVWFAGALVTAVQRTRQVLRIRRRCISSEAAPAEAVNETQHAARSLQLKRPPIVVVGHVPSPCLFCLNLGRPTLIWPRNALTEVCKYRAVITHELAHLKRRDHWISWLDLLTSCVWWWNPIFYYVSNKVRETSEVASDALAVTLCSESREQYATLFLEFSHATPKLDSWNLSLPAAGSSKQLFYRRISMILDERTTGRVSWGGVMLAGVVLLMTAPAFAQRNAEGALEKARTSKVAGETQPTVSDDLGSLDTTQLFQRASQLRPDDGESRTRIALAMVRQGIGLPAIDLLREALNINPQSAEAHNTLGYVLLRRPGKAHLDEAIQHFEKALAIKPGFADVHNNLGLALIEKDGAGRGDQAVEHYQEALRSKPDDPEIHFNLGIAFSFVKQHQKTIEHLKQALQLKPDYPDAHFNLAVTLARVGQLEEAIEHFRESTRQRPDFFEAHDNMALAYSRMNHMREAIAATQEALRIAKSRQNHRRLTIVALEKRIEYYRAVQDIFRGAS